MNDIPEIQSIALRTLLMEFRCPHCQAKILRGESAIGKTLRCDHCQGSYSFPNALILTGTGPIPEATPAQSEQAVRDMLDGIHRDRQLNPKHDPDCPECRGTGARDSGGTEPWGEAIYLTCDCRNPRLN